VRTSFSIIWNKSCLSKKLEIARVGGRYGSPQYQVRLLAKPDAKVLSVLSEGEQTCIALAAFLAEVATMDHCSALVFDDPVTSLDHRWRKKSRSASSRKPPFVRLSSSLTI
jgi:hypothetical protein